jgi:integrase
MIDVQIEMPDGSVTRVRKVSPVQTKRGAEQYEREVREAVLAGTRVGEEETDDEDEKEEPIPTLAAMWPDFIAFQASSANKRPNRRRTVLEAERLFNAYLKPLLGDTTVDKITPRVIDRITARLQAGQLSRRPLKHNTVANILGLLRRMLNVAKRWGHLHEVPEINSLKSKGQRIEGDRWLTEKEATSLIEACEPQWRPMVLVAVRTGLRVGELQGLRWGDVDLDGGRLVVERSWSDQLQDVGPPKGGTAREIPLAWDAVATFRALTETREPKALVFGTDRPFRQDELRRALRRAQRAAGIDKHVHVHMLRHTWASHCIMQGIASRVVMRWGGWTSEAMLDRYAHLAPREIEAMIQRIAPQHASLRVVKAEEPRHHGGTAEARN